MNGRVMLVYPDYSGGIGFGLPVGLGYVAKGLEIAGFEYEVIDLNIDSEDELIRRIGELHPQFLGISMMSYRCKQTYRLLHEVKEVFPGLKIVAGGPHLAANRERVLIECPAIDIGVIGEGEVAIVEIVRGNPIATVKGALYREGDAVKFAGARDFVCNLDDIPFPTYQGFKLENYGKTMQLNSSRGCPYKCIFCGGPGILGNRWRKRSAQSMMEEVKYWYERGYRTFYFSDSNFAIDKMRIENFCEEVMRSNLHVQLIADGLRADHVDQKLLEQMRQAGFTHLTFGVESGSDKVLRNLKKGETREQIESAICTATGLGFHVTLFFLIGSPGEDAKDIAQSFQLARKYNVERVYFFNLTPITGTEFYDWTVEQGFVDEFETRYPEDNIGFSKEALLPTDVMTKDQLTHWIRKARHLEQQIERRYELTRTIEGITRKQIHANNVFLNTLFSSRLFYLTVNFLIILGGRIIIIKFAMRVARWFSKVTARSRHARLFSIYTHLTEQERVLLFKLAKSLPPHSTIVEIGSYLGASTCFLAAGTRLNGGKVYAVDTWTNIGMSEGARDTYQDFICNTAPLNNWIVPLRGLSKEVSQKFNEKVDLLFVDGDHSYEAVRADLEAWLHKVKDGGIVVFHDYSCVEGVRRAVREFVVPIQIEGGRRLDNMYWTTVSQENSKRSQHPLLASVIVPTYGRPSYLREALLSIQAQEFDSDEYEIIAVDNSPSPSAESIVGEVNQNGLHPVRYVHEPRLGLHNARHAGAREARGAILVYVDDDVIVHPKWLSAMVEAFNDPQVACVGGKVLPKWQQEPPEWLTQFDGSYLSLLNLGDQRLKLKWPEGVYGCNMALRRATLYEAGGFHPDAIGDRRLIWLRGNGETGLYKKIHDAGYKVVYEPHAWLYHLVPASRLTPEYFYWRSFIQGISDSYSQARATKSSRVFLLKLLYHGVTCLLTASRYYVNSVWHPDNRIRLKADAWCWYGRGMHQIRTALSRGLRKHVLKDSYL